MFKKKNYYDVFNMSQTWVSTITSLECEQYWSLVTFLPYIFQLFSRIRRFLHLHFLSHTICIQVFWFSPIRLTLPVLPNFIYSCGSFIQINVLNRHTLFTISLTPASKCFILIVWIVAPPLNTLLSQHSKNKVITKHSIKITGH